MSSHRNADPDNRHIDYCLHILGIRVWENTCQLLAKCDGQWVSLGGEHNLPIQVPETSLALQKVGTDPLMVTAWQYEREHLGTDISEVLSQRKSFTVALTEHDD